MMLWPFGRHERTQGDKDMDEALWESERALTDAQHLRTRAETIGERMRQTGSRNHFGEAVRRRLQGEL